MGTYCIEMFLFVFIELSQEAVISTKICDNGFRVDIGIYVGAQISAGEGQDWTDFGVRWKIDIFDCVCDRPSDQQTTRLLGVRLTDRPTDNET